jgi:hypothetical protein
MGYDLTAKRRKRGAVGYYRSGIEFMTFLRSAMVAAGVQDALVYKKFVSNDNWLVTPRQSKMIAERLATWLRGRNLTLDLAEANEGARASTDGLRFVLRAVGNKKEEARLARNRRAKSLPLRVGRRARKVIRKFAAFCAESGGFHVS